MSHSKFTGIPFNEDDLVKMLGGKIVVIGGKKFLNFSAPTHDPVPGSAPAPPTMPNLFGDIVCSTKSGIVGIISKNLKQQYFIGVPEGHIWFNQKASYFNSLDVPISLYGKVSGTDLDSIEKDGKLMRSVAIQMSMDSLSDKRKRYWITWDCNQPPGPGLFNLLKTEVRKICENANKL